MCVSFEQYFRAVERTMCPSDVSGLLGDAAQSPLGGVVMNVEVDDLFLFYVDVFSSSIEEQSYSIQVDVVPQFVLM